MENELGNWGDQGSSPSFSLGMGAAPGEPADLLERLLGFATCTRAQEQLIPCSDVPGAPHRVVLREGSLGSADFLFSLSLYKPPPRPKC